MTFEASGDDNGDDVPPDYASVPPDPCGLDAIDPSDLFDPPDALDLVVEVADMRASFAAQQLVRVDAMRREALRDAETHGRGLTDVLERSVRLELAAALRITEHAAGEMISFAEALVHRYPDVWESLYRARMTERHAMILVEAVDQVEPALRAPVLARAIALAEAEPVGTFRRALRKLVDTARAETLGERFQRATLTRRIVVVPAEDNMAWLMALAPAVEVHAIHGRVTAKAKVLAADPSETRTLDQLRADVFADLLIDGDTPLHPDQARGIRATVAVTVPGALAAG